MPRNRFVAFASATALLASAGAYVACGAEADSDTTQSVTFALGSHLSGAIFTTTVNGSRVNANLYPKKEDVYLDGGPGANAPSAAAGLPEGNYFYQVTDPSGKDLLSTDHISCRKVHVNAQGVIDTVYAGTNYVWNKGAWGSAACQHGQGVDQDHSGDGAITVQLFPYDDTPNSGGVYKAWMTPVAEYTKNAAFVPTKKSDVVNGEAWAPANAHGFVPAYSKTDNFKVEKHGRPCTPPSFTVSKFHDQNVNGTKESGESDISGWGVSVADPLGSNNQYYTPVSVVASVGGWGVLEDRPLGTMQTSSFLDGTRLSMYPEADPLVELTIQNECSGETHAVSFGNVGTGDVEACKVYDRNGNGISEVGEPPVSGWKMVLTGNAVTGATVGPVEATTGVDGCADFPDLLPGSYTLEEKVPATGGWVATSNTTAPVTIESSLSEGALVGTSFGHDFTNVCVGSADFDTKGYWHNKNGLAEMTAADIAYANGLTPYMAPPSSYFGAGDEPFDGLFEGGSPVAAAFDGLDGQIAAAGTPRAEVSQFLVDPNANGDPREQLAQQLLAFVFNTRHSLDGAGAALQMPDGSFRTAQSLIDDAILAWSTGSAADRTAMSQLLDGFNNDDSVSFVHNDPCAVTY